MFEPRIVCFFCKWCTYAGADLAGTSRKQYPPNGVVVRVNCSGRIDPQHVLWAFREGADGVLIGGCHPGDCHYQDGNYKTMRRVSFLRKMLEDMGVDPTRLHLEWISAAEGDKLVHVMGDFVETVRGMGPIKLKIAGDGRGRAMRAIPRAPTKPAKKKAAAKPKKTVKAKARAKPKKKAATKVAAKKRPARPKKKVAEKKLARPKKKVARKKLARPKKKVAKKRPARPKKKVARKRLARPKKKVAKAKARAAARPSGKATKRKAALKSPRKAKTEVTKKTSARTRAK